MFVKGGVAMMVRCYQVTGWMRTGAFSSGPLQLVIVLVVFEVRLSVVVEMI